MDLVTKHPSLRLLFRHSELCMSIGFHSFFEAKCHDLFIWQQRTRETGRGKREEKRGGERGWRGGRGATSNPSGMSQAVSPGDMPVEWKTLGRVEVSRARLATVSPAMASLSESRRWHSKKPTRQEGRRWKETKAESTPPLYAVRQAA